MSKAIRDRKHNYKRRYGITVDEYNALVEKQKGRCAICERKKKLAVDHNHKTKVIRGLLCIKCNSGIGLLGDNIKGLKQAIRYLEQCL